MSLTEKFAVWRYTRRARRAERLIAKAFRVAPVGYVPDIVSFTFDRAVRWARETGLVAVVMSDSDNSTSVTLH